MRPLRAAVLLSLCGLASAQDWTTFHSAYEDGLRAQARGEFALAQRAFARAALLEPVPGTRVRTYGLNFLPAYHPYLRLAEAALAAGDLDAAERALDASDQYRKEPQPARDALRARLKAARAVPPEPAPPAPAVATPAPPPPPAPPAPKVEPAPELPLPPAPPAPARRPPPEAPVALPPPAPVAPAPKPPDTPAQPPRSPRWPWWALLGSGTLLALWAARPRRRRPSAATLKVNPFRPADLTADADTQLPAPGPDPNLGRAFGPWKPDAVLGVGGCATAYHAVHTVTGIEAALKIPHRNLIADPDFQARFRREAALGALLDHPNIVRILDPGPADGLPWLAMRFVRGETLEARLVRDKPLPVPEAAAIALQVAEALAYAHSQGVVHRDLKPANLMLSDGAVTVMDFGIARILDGTMTATALFMGTPAYCAPECIVTPRVGPAADRYALGIILFEMLTGHPPFKGDTHFQILEAQRSSPLPSLETLRPDLPGDLTRLVQRLCAKAPLDRPEDGEIIARLKGY